MASEIIRKMTAFELIDQRFAAGDMSAVTQYIDALQYPLVVKNSSSGSYIVDPPLSEQTQLYQNSDIYLDRGDGRVSRGLRGLELLSKVCKGVNPEDLFMFHNVIYASTPNRIKAASKLELIDIVTDNIGMRYLVDSARKTPTSEDLTKYESLCYRIGTEVKNGVFKRENYSKTMLLLTRRLAVIAERNGIKGE